MVITLDDLTANFNHLDRESLLEDWQWLLGDTKLPILISALGDAFVQDTDDGGVHLLDVGAGELTQVADNVQDFQALLGDREFVTDTLLPGLIIELRNAGKTLGPGEIYSFVNPPVLGGEYEVANLDPTLMEVHFSVFGQIYRQVADLPEGTPISEIKLVER
jgi:hypothetical protein